MYSPAPAKPYQIPQVQLTPGGVAMVTHRTITIRLPACFYNDDNGPIVKIQVIVAESGGMARYTHTHIAGGVFSILMHKSTVLYEKNSSLTLTWCSLIIFDSERHSKCDRVEERILGSSCPLPD